MMIGSSGFFPNGLAAGHGSFGRFISCSRSTVGELVKIAALFGVTWEGVFSVFMLVSLLLSFALSYVIRRLLPRGVSARMDICIDM